MFKPNDTSQLVIDLIPRSICAVQVAAAICDRHGIVSWGWNSVGDGFGEHAEMAAIRRANRRRLPGSTIYVASTRLRNGKSVTARPCNECAALLSANGIYRVVWRDPSDSWRLSLFSAD